MAWDLGSLVIKNVSGGALDVRGYTMAVDEEVDLMSMSSPSQLQICWMTVAQFHLRNPDPSQPTNALGCLKAEGKIAVTNIRYPDKSTWIGNPPWAP